MKVTAKIAIVLLVVGCVLVQECPEPSEDPFVKIAELQAALQTLTTRVTSLSADLEAAKASAGRCNCGDAIAQLRGNLQQQIGQTNEAGKALQAAVASVRDEQYRSNFWTPIERAHVGSYGFKGLASVYPVGLQVAPTTAKQILVQLEWATGYTPLTHFYNTAVWTQHSDGRQFKFWASGWRQNVVSMYSDSQTVWLPIAETNRQIYIHCTTAVNEARPNLHMNLWVLGYK